MPRTAQATAAQPSAPQPASGFTVHIHVSHQQIADQMVAAIEGGYAPWLGTVDADAATKALATDDVWYADAKVWGGAFEVTIQCDDPETEEDDGGHTLTKVIHGEDIERGLAVMAAKYQRQFAQMTSDDGDAITAQLFLQCVVYGEEVYS